MKFVDLVFRLEEFERYPLFPDFLILLASDANCYFID